MTSYFLHLSKPGTKNVNTVQNLHLVRMSMVPKEIWEAKAAVQGRKDQTPQQKQKEEQWRSDKSELMRMWHDQGYLAAVRAEARKTGGCPKCSELIQWYDNWGERR